MHKYYLTICLSIISFVVKNQAARILAVFPFPSISHQVVFRCLTQELAKRGHELVIMTTDPAFPKNKTPPNITEIDLHQDSYQIWHDRFIANKDIKTQSGFRLQTSMFEIIYDIFDAQLSNKEVQNVIKNERKFDLVIVEACIRPALIFGYIMKTPIVQVSSLGPTLPNIQSLGADSHILLYPDITRNRLYNLSIREKIESMYQELQFRIAVWVTSKKENQILRKHFGTDTPTPIELQNLIDLLIVNSHPVWSDNRAVPPSFIYTGGLHKKPVSQLNEDLKKYLESSEKGVIYVSFGTNVDPTTLPDDQIKVFTKVLSKLPYDVLWKWNGDNMTGKPDNARISKWFPQSDLLWHPKVKLFITQAGLQSTDEAISAGVPLIAFPMHSDQWFNAEKYELHKIGLNLNIKTVTEDILRTAIVTVITDKSYRNNIKKLRDIMNDHPQPPLDRAVWWIEYVIRHRGAAHLRSATANISWSEYLMIDVICTLLVFIFVVLGVLIYLNKLVSSYFKSGMKKKTC